MKSTARNLYSGLLWMYVIMAAVSLGSTSHKLPSSFKRCRQNDAHLNDCLRVAVQDAFNKMMNGLPKLGILSLNPLQVSDILIRSEGAVSIEKMHFKKVLIHGLKGTKILKYKANLKQYILETESYTDQLSMEGEYTIAGQILILPISGEGKSNITLILGDAAVTAQSESDNLFFIFISAELHTNHTLIGEPVMKDNKLHMILKEYIVSFKPKLVTFNFENLFNGNKRLGDTMNKFMNDNWQIMFNELKGPFQVAFGEVFKEISNRLFSKIPFDNIFIKASEHKP
ncbi:juvenile hormone binding protein 12 [Lycorma delicatula]|uniref:juvenile hormone binding protein 12 n=1 Tax=Lycorma delicatula TaxID=130591 RepID=UPI003F514D02